MSACVQGGTAPAAGRTIKLGYVSPQTSALAPFGEADSFTVSAIRRRDADHALGEVDGVA